MPSWKKARMSNSYPVTELLESLAEVEPAFVGQKENVPLTKPRRPIFFWMLDSFSQLSVSRALFSIFSQCTMFSSNAIAMPYIRLNIENFSQHLVLDPQLHIFRAMQIVALLSKFSTNWIVNFSNSNKSNSFEYCWSTWFVVHYREVTASGHLGFAQWLLWHVAMFNEETSKCVLESQGMRWIRLWYGSCMWTPLNKLHSGTSQPTFSIVHGVVN